MAKFQLINGAARASETRAHARRAVAKHRGETVLSDLEQRVVELRGYERKTHEESFIWEPREVKFLWFTITLGYRRVPSIGTVASRLFNQEKG